MKHRILEVRKDSHLNQDAFAGRLGLSKNFISLLETGKRVPSDRTIADICKEFNVNEEWLRTGKGEKFCPLSIENAVRVVLSSMNCEDTVLPHAIISTMLELTADEWDVLKRIADKAKGR